MLLGQDVLAQITRDRHQLGADAWRSLVLDRGVPTVARLKFFAARSPLGDPGAQLCLIRLPSEVLLPDATLALRPLAHEFLVLLLFEHLGLSAPLAGGGDVERFTLVAMPRGGLLLAHVVGSGD